jgi:hypothetical protein
MTSVSPIAISRDQIRGVGVAGPTPVESHVSACLPDSAFNTPVVDGRARRHKKPSQKYYVILASISDVDRLNCTVLQVQCNGILVFASSVI